MSGFLYFSSCHIILVQTSSWGPTCLQSVGHYETKICMFGFTESKITLSGTAEGYSLHPLHLIYIRCKVTSRCFNYSEQNSNLCRKKSSGHLWTFSLQEPTDSPLQIPDQVFNYQLINWCLKKCSFLVLHSIKLGQTLRAVVSVRGRIHSRVSTFIVAPLTSVLLNRSTGLEGSAHTVQMWSIKPTVRYLATGDLGSINFRKNKETKTSIG